MKKIMQACCVAMLVTGAALAGLARAEETVPAPAAKYPVDYCVVSGEKLGEMGEPYVLQHEGREIQLCCKKCAKKFLNDPAKYLSKLDAAAKEPAKAQ